MDTYEKLARFYDLDHAHLTADLIFYSHLARQAAGPVLEVGCGSGRLLQPLLEAEVEVTGIDTSPAMLALARRRVGDRALLIEGDMRTVTLPGRYALIIISINTFMHLQTTSDQLATLTNLRRYLAADGQLVIDLPAGDELAHQDPNACLMLEKTFLDPVTGYQVIKLVSSQVDWIRQRQEVTYVYDELLENGVRRTVVPMTLRYVFRYELILLLEKAGYSLVTLYGDYDMSPYNDGGGPRMIALAQKDA